MAAWLVPALKAVLPHVGTIISAAVPVFTKKSQEAEGGPSGLLQKQITELQTAAAQNAENIRELAGQLQTTVTALEQSAALVEKRMRRLLLFSVLAAAIALFALGMTLWSVRAVAL